ncbi:MAG TPA: hypothetical protein VMF55_13725 [Solirubrobacterales bacterium]|nr:hypothetical protein [Solirubrobacterales bacterium]
MKRRRPPVPSPALLIACLALFVALGGTVLAATKIDGRTIRVKSLPGNRLKVASLPGNRLQSGTIPGSRLVPRSVTAKQIAVGSLGPVPNAEHADSADTARRSQTAIAAEHASDASTVNGRVVGCRAGTREFAGACWDISPSTDALTAMDAVTACATRGGELPEALALIKFGSIPGVEHAVGGEWLDQIWFNSETTYGVFLLSSEGHFLVKVPTELHRFRCVTPFIS